MTNGYHRAERDTPRTALRIGAFAKRRLSGGDIWIYASGPRRD